MSDDTELLPIGCILPFKPGKIPAGWHPFDGSSLERSEYPELWERLSQGEMMTDMWRTHIGGEITEDLLILPEIDDSNVYKLMGWPKQMARMVLAIRVQRT